MEYFRVTIESNYKTIVKSMEQAKGYRSAIRQAVKKHKGLMKPFFGYALTVSVRRMETNNKNWYFIRLGKRGAIKVID